MITHLVDQLEQIVGENASEFLDSIKSKTGEFDKKVCARMYLRQIEDATRDYISDNNGEMTSNIDEVGSLVTKAHQDYMAMHERVPEWLGPIDSAANIEGFAFAKVAGDHQSKVHEIAGFNISGLGEYEQLGLIALRTPKLWTASREFEATRAEYVTKVLPYVGD